MNSKVLWLPPLAILGNVMMKHPGSDTKHKIQISEMFPVSFFSNGQAAARVSECECECESTREAVGRSTTGVLVSPLGLALKS